MLAFPLGDPLTPGIDPQSVRGGVGDPGADGGALRHGGVVDGVGEVGGK